MDKDRFTVYIDKGLIDKIKTKYGNYSLSALVNNYFKVLVNGKQDTTEIEEKTNNFIEAIRSGETVAQKVADSHKRIEEAKSLSLERQDELEKRVKEWRSLFAQGTNEGSKIAETQALTLKRNIMEEFGLDSAQFVKLAWGN